MVYYVRLSEGAANGIAMIHIEAVNLANTDSLQRGFYTGADAREEIDADARYSAQRQTNGFSAGQDPNSMIDHTVSRVFLNPGNNGNSRIVLWSWCPTPDCPGTNTVPGGPFEYWLISEAGITVQNTTIMLNHIVNVIDVTGTDNGWVWINGLPDNFQTFGFVSNAAEGSALETWEAMFPTVIWAQWTPIP